MGSLVVKASGLGPEDPGSIPDAAKDPLRKCGILARKVRGSENPVVGRSLAVYHGYCLWKKFPSLSEIYQNLWKWSMDDAAIFRCEAEIEFLLLQK